jgi:hypothetical protein
MVLPDEGTPDKRIDTGSLESKTYGRVFLTSS